MWTKQHRARHEASLKQVVLACAVEEVARWLEGVDPPHSEGATAVQDQVVPHAGNAAQGAVVTVSVGCCTTIPGHRSSQDTDADVGAFVAACDRALYAAKHAGRNRVVAQSSSQVTLVTSELSF